MDDTIERGFARAGVALPRSGFVLRTDDQVANWRLVEAGAGIGFTQAWIGSRSPHVVRVLPDLVLPSLPMTSPSGTVNNRDR